MRAIEDLRTDYGSGCKLDLQIKGDDLVIVTTENLRFRG